MSEHIRLAQEIDRACEEQERNRRLAERIANGTDSMRGQLDRVIELVEQMARAHLDIPGPRALQLIEEIRRLSAQANCGEGHDPTRICCAHAHQVKQIRRGE